MKETITPAPAPAPAPEFPAAENFGKGKAIEDLNFDIRFAAFARAFTEQCYESNIWFEDHKDELN